LSCHAPNLDDLTVKKEEKKKIVEFRKKDRKKKISKWTGLFSVNGLGLNFCGIFEENRSDFGKKEGKKQ
jgi:hypothetical protein